MKTNLLSQLQSNRWKLVMIFGISFLLIGVVALVRIWKGIPTGVLTRDISATVGVPPYVGFLSQIGNIVWIVAFTLCIFSASVCSKNKGMERFKKYLYMAGLLTLLLCFDDLFLLHEEVFPSFGIPEKVVFLTYGIFVFFFLLKFRPVILQTNYILLATAFFFFGSSVMLDFLRIPGLDSVLFEDGAKLVGIISWSFYFYSNAVVAVSTSKEYENTLVLTEAGSSRVQPAARERILA